MGEIAEMMLESFMDEETGEVIDGASPGYPRRMSDQRSDHEVQAPMSTRTMSCVVPGCQKKFKPGTNYKDFICHYTAKHAPKAPE